MKHKSYNIPVIILSIVVPLMVAALYYLKPPSVRVGFDIKIIPALNASINFTVTLLLLLGYYFMMTGRFIYHKYTMITAFCLSILFLVSYLIYHSVAPETPFGGTGWIRTVYFFILITHIVLAAVIVPMVLFTLIRGLQEQFDKHRRIAKWTWPVWLYVSVTGVMIYLLLSPYYT